MAANHGTQPERMRVAYTLAWAATVPCYADQAARRVVACDPGAASPTIAEDALLSDSVVVDLPRDVAQAVDLPLDLARIHAKPGTYVVSAVAEGYQKATLAPFTVKEGANTAPTLALTAIPAPVVGTVTGTVTDSAGKP